MLVIAITIYCISCCIKEPMECLSLLPNYFDVPQASVYLFYFQVSASLAEKIHDLRMNCSSWVHVYKMTVYIYMKLLFIVATAADLTLHMLAIVPIVDNTCNGLFHIFP